MANDSNDEKTGAPVLDDVTTAREAEAAVREAATGAAAAPSPSADSPKPHGDKLGNAVREAADAPPKDKG
jgi:hypothetical protein